MTDMVETKFCIHVPAHKDYHSKPYTIYVRIFSTQEYLQTYLRTYQPWRLPDYMFDDEESKVIIYGCCHKNKKSCTLLLARDQLKPNIVFHELLHAILHMYKTPNGNLYLKGHASIREEQLCHSFDSAFARLNAKLYDLGLYQTT